VAENAWLERLQPLVADTPSDPQLKSTSPFLRVGTTVTGDFNMRKKRVRQGAFLLRRLRRYPRELPIYKWKQRDH